MSSPKKLVQIVHNLCRLVVQIGRTLTRKVMQWLLRTLMKSRRSPQLQKGFVLPTVTMVMLVVVLLTTAIMLRSFDRSKNASNYRVNQAVMNAAEPALDRAKQKLNELFDPSSGTRGTPSEIQFNSKLGETKYTFADETRLQLAYDIDGNGSIRDDPNSDLRIRETNVNAWRFPVDTDNNGRYDSFTLYSILFRSPTRTATGFNRKRNPLEARTPPMDEGALGGFCAAAAGTSASLVGDSDWYQAGGSLKKPFFIYVATVPITDLTQLKDQDGNALTNNANYEEYKGNQGFSALEYQQDRSVAPPSNNAVLYEDDLDIFSGPGLRLNGRVFTNSNLFVSEFNYTGAGELELYQVSSDESCFYRPENSQIIVAGNTGYGDASTANDADINRVLTDGAGEEVRVDLFDGRNTDPITDKSLSKANKSVTEFSAPTAYNTQAYEQRIQWLTDTAIAEITNPDNDPEAVKEKKDQLLADDPTGSLTADDARQQAMEIYFRNRTRRVPFAEVAFGSSEADAIEISGSAPTDSDIEDLGGPDMRPPDAWIYPFDPTDGKTSTNYSKLTLHIDTDTTGGDTLLPKAITPEVVEDNNGQETLVGDRVLVGHGLPAVWDGEKQEITGVKWHEDADNASTETRYRQTRSEPVRDLDIAGRDGFWEQKAVESPPPENPLAGVGGLRVITGAGVYLPDDSTSTTQVVWPDWMPVPDTGSSDFIIDIPADQDDDLSGNIGDSVDDDLNDDRPYLRMRATAVYHYTENDGQTPIACVSSFYDPTTSETARNRATDFGGTDISVSQYDVSGISAGSTGVRNANANSLNGITYASPSGNYTSRQTDLEKQADLFYPNGRFVNPQLKAAVDKNGTNLSLAEQAAVDSTICALEILEGTLALSTTYIPHGTIKEVAFLDGRQVKLIDQVVSDTSTENGYNPAGFDMANQVSDFSDRTYYNYPIEQRYPLEIRATEIDLDKLRQKSMPTTGEYLFPNSGIIYATRDDALPDQSDANLKVSATDFKLDPTRRPNGIVLVNGQQLWRTQDYRQVEKGLTLASNLPVYIKGNFNRHDHEEFTNDLEDDWGNFYTRTQAQLNESFACRQGDPRLPNCDGDNWRAANVISDAITLLSDGFRYGFRDEGDYDLRNNRIDNNLDFTFDFTGDGDTNDAGESGLLSAEDIRDKREAQGFLNNNFVTSHDFQDADYRSTSTTPLNSSYFNNFVTPIQRRVLFPEYVMEICRKLPVSECTADDWVTGYDFDGVLSGAVNAAEVAAGIADIADEAADAAAAAASAAQDALDEANDKITEALGLTDPTEQQAALTEAKDKLQEAIDKINEVAGETENAATQANAVADILEDGTAEKTTAETARDEANTAATAAKIEPTEAPQTTVDAIDPADSSTITQAQTAATEIQTALTSANDAVDKAGAAAKVAQNLNLDQQQAEEAASAAVPRFHASELINELQSHSPAVDPFSADFNPTKLVAGTTARPALSLGDRRFPRRVAFLRYVSSTPSADLEVSNLSNSNTLNTPDAAKHVLVLDNNTPIPLGISSAGHLEYYPYQNDLRIEENRSSLIHPANAYNHSAGYRPRLQENALWFANNNNQYSFDYPLAYTLPTNNTGQPLLTPVLQIHVTDVILNPDATFSGLESGNNANANSGFANIMNISTLMRKTQWLMHASGDTTFNLLMATGDNPSRPPSGTIPAGVTGTYANDVGESNGGLANLARFIESWDDDTTAKINQISGSFIQLKRSQYATAPFWQLQGGTKNNDIKQPLNARKAGPFGYPQMYRPDTSDGKSPFFAPPERVWGFDVGLLSQSPDLFSQQFAQSFQDDPSEFFREVSRDDDWVQTLLCAKMDPDNDGTYDDAAINANQRPTSFCNTYTGG